MRHPQEAKVILELSDGEQLGDAFCILLLKEYEEIYKDDELSKKFITTIVTERIPRKAYRSWLYLHKGIFYDERYFLI